MRNPLTTRRSNFPAQGPWRALAEFENQIDRLFGSRLTPFPSLPEMAEGFDFAPTTEFQETDKDYVLKIDIPGIKKEDVKIEVEGNRLTVSGERKEEKESKDAKRHYSESSYGSFMRSFTLAQAIDEGKVKAQYSDGVLKVTVPKAEKSQSKTVPIQ